MCTQKCRVAPYKHIVSLLFVYSPQPGSQWFSYMVCLYKTTDGWKRCSAAKEVGHELSIQACCTEGIHSLCISAPVVNLIMLPLSHLLSPEIYFLRTVNTHHAAACSSGATPTSA